MRRLVLVAAFATLGGVAGCGRGAPASSGPGPTLPRPNRALTSGERALLRPLFRDGIDYDAVRVVHGRYLFQPGDTYMTPRGHIYAPGPLYREDFSLEAEDRAVLVHEIGHVWQFANGVDLVASAIAELARYRGDYERAYAYRLEPGRDLAEYGVEQQASILEDYYLLTAGHGEPSQLENRGLSARARTRLYGSVLRKFLADARYARARAVPE